MSRQVSYVISAFFLIILLIGVSLFIIKLPATDGHKSKEAWCGTVDPVSNNHLSENAQKGKMLFMSKCASCHILFKEATGPSLIGFEERGPWTDRKNVYEWIKNPAAFMRNNGYTRNLKARYGSMMSAFGDMSNDEIDAICDYIKEAGRSSSKPLASN